MPFTSPVSVPTPVPPLVTVRAFERVSDPALSALTVAFVEKRFVLDAVVEKNDVEVACPSVTLPLNVLVPEKVLLVVVPKARESVLDENWSG